MCGCVCVCVSVCVKNGVLLDEEEIVAENEAVDKGQGVTDQGNDACV